MEFTLKQISSLEKVRTLSDLDCSEVKTITALAGERVSYQLCLCGKDPVRFISVSAKSTLGDAVRLYSVKDVYMDRPVTEDFGPEDYITKEPGFMPDLMIPLEEQNNQITLDHRVNTLWVRVDIPKDLEPGKYQVTVSYRFQFQKYSPCILSSTMEVEVLPVRMPKQKLIYTRWFHADCIADYHNVEVYSEKHWEWIEKYMRAAADVGMNMILVPIHTPPLDTAFGMERTCCQLVDIEKKGDRYVFDFQKFDRYIEICKKCGMEYFEMAHMFSQANAKYPPNIMVTENGKSSYMFGWNIEADAKEYSDFLKQYIPAITEQLEKAGIAEHTYFHICDEPSLPTMENYRKAAEIVRPLIGRSKTFDALSEYDFYEKGLVECPVTIATNIHEFLEHSVPNQWLYYCCGPQSVFTNSIMAMPSYRVRIAGLQMYRYDIKGFLHWGLNFYNSVDSTYHINPYVTTSVDRAFPSGDPFVLYPGKEQVYGCIRGEVFYQALQDMKLCLAAEERIGREAVTQILDETAGEPLRFDRYPKGNTYIENVRARLLSILIN